MSDKIDPKMCMDGKILGDMPANKSDAVFDGYRDAPDENAFYEVSNVSIDIEQEHNFLKGFLAEYLQYGSTDGNPKRQVLRAKLKEMIK